MIALLVKIVFLARGHRNFETQKQLSKILSRVFLLKNEFVKKS